MGVYKPVVDIAGSAGSCTGNAATASAPQAGSALDKKTTKARVNFNGSGTVAIREQLNVSSLTDNGTGNYTVNFSAALASANYAFVCTGRNLPMATVSDVHYGLADGATPSATALNVSCHRNNGAAYDPDYFNVIIEAD